MKIRAEQKNSRQTARKVRLLANQVKDLSLIEALRQLALMERKSSIVLLKVFRQAIANAVNNHQLKIEDLEIDKLLVKTGSTYKRFRAVSRGRAHRILKRTCHVEVVLKTKENQADPIAVKKQKLVKTAKPKKIVKKSAVKKQKTVKQAAAVKKTAKKIKTTSKKETKK